MKITFIYLIDEYLGYFLFGGCQDWRGARCMEIGSRRLKETDTLLILWVHTRPAVVQFLLTTY